VIVVLGALVAVPVAGALLCAVVPRAWVHAAAVVTAAVVAGLAGWAVLGGVSGNYRSDIADLPWLADRLDAPVFGVSLDPLAAVLLVVVAAIGLLTVLYSTAYLGERTHVGSTRDRPRYYFWLLLFIASMVGIALAPNLLQLFFFWELTTVCSWALISFYRDEEGLQAGFRALVMTHIGGLFFLFAILVVFVATGSFEFDALGRLGGEARVAVFLCLIVAAWAKSAQVPLHTWLPDAMAAPTPISAYLHAAAMVKAGVYLVARSAAGADWSMPPGVALILVTMAMATILIALSFYFVQDDLKRLLAYSTIAHLGYVLVGIGLGVMGAPIAVRGGLLHIICHGFAKATLFFAVGAIVYATGSRKLSELGGLGRSMPITAVAFFTGVFAVAGVPPFSCFFSKLMILAGALELGTALGVVVFVALLCETLIAFAWMLRVAQRVFLGAPTSAVGGSHDPPLAMTVTLLILVIGCLGAPLVGVPLVAGIGP